jgi:RNA polymerase sigma-70 factor (ECF subfamily)
MPNGWLMSQSASSIRWGSGGRAAAWDAVFDKAPSGRRRFTYTTKLKCHEFSEAEAIERAKQGDAEAFEFLYRTHQRRVYSLCLRMTGNVTVAENLTQDTFVQVFRKIGTFRQEAAFSTWLHRTAVNVVLMHFRKKSLTLVPLEDTSESDDAPRHEPGEQDGMLMGLIDRLDLTRAIGDLPRGYRTIFLLHDVEGYEHNEIAAMMGCTIGNSKSQLYRARMRLRDFLKTGRTEKPVNRRASWVGAISSALHCD